MRVLKSRRYKTTNRRIGLVHAQDDLADVFPGFHPRMCLCRVNERVGLVDHWQATPSGEHRPNVLT